MRRFFQFFWIPLYRRWGLWYIRQERVYTYAGVQVRVPPGVFHPGVYFSTPIFIDFLGKIDFSEKKTLDIGTGSGMLALFTAKKGAKATAIDINPLAIHTAQQNAELNHLPLRCLESDLFDRLPPDAFDYVLINPPYYPKKATTAAEHAFFAGENLEYFVRLFTQLPQFIHIGTKIWLIMSEDCDMEKIGAIAAVQGFRLEIVFEHKKWGERLFVVEAKRD